MTFGSDQPKFLLYARDLKELEFLMGKCTGGVVPSFKDAECQLIFVICPERDDLTYSELDK